MSQNISQDDDHLEEAVAAFAIQEPKWYERIASIIDYLTYISEETDKEGNTKYFRRRLSPLEKDLYRIIRQRSNGGDGKCSAGSQTLASQVGCGKNTISLAKKVLEMPFEQLGGNSLIEITEKQVKRIGEKGPFEVKQHVISVSHIWSWNNAFSKMRPDSYPSTYEELTKDQAELAIERMNQRNIFEFVHKEGGHPSNRTSGGGSSYQRDVNKPLNNKTSCYKKEHPPTESDLSFRDSSVSFVSYSKQKENETIDFEKALDSALQTDKEKSDLSKNALARSVLLSLDLEEAFKSEYSAMHHLQSLGFTEKVTNKLMQKGLDSLYLAAAYVKRAIENPKKKKEIGAINGYFITVLEKKWYLPKQK